MPRQTQQNDRAPPGRHERKCIAEKSATFPALVGDGRKVRTLAGQVVPYLNVDNAATTPAFALVHAKLMEFLESYGSVHRGSGYKSQVSTETFDAASEVILDFVGANSDKFAI